jgi:tRNA(Ile)-lysidine synthase
MGPHPAVAAIRLAVRRALHDVLSEQAVVSENAGDTRSPGEPPLVLVACSGGADSMALASALAFEAPRLGLRAGGVTIDHGLQAGSADRAQEVAERLTNLRLHPVESIAITIGRTNTGPEAAARTARYAALDDMADRCGAKAVLLGHTRDDQAETVLLGLARGSGTRSLSGMAEVTGPADRYRRPFLAIDRQTTRKACLAQSLPVWDDPHNDDPAYTRSRVRHEALPVLEKALGKGVVEALARTARLSRDDADALDSWALQAERAVRTDQPGTDGWDGVELDTARLYALPSAVRRRVLRRAAVAAGAPAGSLFARHLEEVDRLLTAWRGQRAINLPGRVEAARQGGRLVIRHGSQTPPTPTG